MRHGLTVHDSVYLALASVQGCRLVTADRQLYSTCGAGALGRLAVWLGEVG